MFGISLPLIKNIWPRKCNITVVVGTPIHVTKIDNPTDEEVSGGGDNEVSGAELYLARSPIHPPCVLPRPTQAQKLLDRYIQALKQLYEENRTKYNVPPSKPPLEVI